MGLFTRPPQDEGNPRPATYHEPRPITASAVRVNLTNKAEVEAVKKRRETNKWQEDAWDYYDLIGEIKYAAGLIASVTSRVRLYPGWITDGDMTPAYIEDIDGVSDDLKQKAKDAISLLESGNGGIPGLLRDAALNLFVAGECYIVKEPPAEQGMVGASTLDIWQIRSIDEVIVTEARGKQVIKIKESRDTKPADFKQLPPNPFVGRIWRTHPRYSAEADSSLRGILELCDQLLLYSRATRAVTKSVLNAGMLFIPDGFSNMSQGDGEVVPEDPNVIAPQSDDESDSFEEELIDTMITPIADETSAAAVVPMIVRGPAELGEKIRHITFERSYDAQMAKDAERVLERILGALDLPKDVVSGMASVKYSNAITIEESLYKAHIEPLVLMICDALTVVFYRTILRSFGFSEEEVRKTCVWYDPSAITTKPDKATSATTGFELGVLNSQAWRRAHGFSESDKPDGREVIQRLAQEKGLLSEPVVEAALRSLDPELFNQIRQQQEAASEPGALANVQDAADGVIAEEDKVSNKPQEPTEQPPTDLIEP